MKRMLIDAAHPEETRVAVLDGHQLEEFDVESASRKQLKGNIYLAKVTRVEPSLQAAFVDYGGNRHGFLAFNEIHPDYYQIPVADRERLLAEQAAEDEAEEAAEREAEEREEALAESQGAGHGDEPLETRTEYHPDSQPDAQAEYQPEYPAESAAEALSESPATDEADRREAIAEAMPAPDSVSVPVDVDAASDATDENRVELGADNSEHPASSDESAHDHAHDDDEAPEHTGIIEHVETDHAAKPVETLGGDELDEANERRRPPQRALRRYKIQEVIKRRQILLVQVVKEERGNKGAALTTYLSLAGRYCVLMPNTGKGGGISRKIGGGQDRKRLKSIISDLEVPRGMALIVRTAGADRGKAEIKRDYDYLLRLWNDIRTLTLASTAPALIHGEASIINRAIRDLYTRDIEEVVVEGDEAYRVAKDLMKMLIPSHAKKVQAYKDEAVPLFSRYQIENQLESMNSPTVQLKSGGYIVMNATEALVAIDVNSGRATRGRNIEETALKTNLEAATEIARQLRLRDLAGLIVIDFIDMDHSRNQVAVERRLKEAMRRDRARIQIGRISPFGLLELSRQRLRPSLAETVTDVCPHCGGTGILRSTESTALHVLRGIEEEAMKRRAVELTVSMPTSVALYLLNHKRTHLLDLEAKFETRILIANDDSLIPPKFTIERGQAIHHEGDGEERGERAERHERHERPERPERHEREERHERAEAEPRREHREGAPRDGEGGSEEVGCPPRRRRRGRRRGGEGRDDGREGENRGEIRAAQDVGGEDEDFDEAAYPETGGEFEGEPRHEAASGAERAEGEESPPRQGEGRRRRGRRGGRGRNRGHREDGTQPFEQRTAEHRAEPGTELGGEDGDEDEAFVADRADTHEGGQTGASGEGGGRRRRRVRRRGRGPRPEGTDVATGEAAVSAEPTLWAASEHDVEPQPQPAAEPDSVTLDAEPAYETATPAFTEPEPAPVANTSEPIESVPAEPTPVPEEAPAGPPRRGWWQRLVE